jgi:flagellar operon protein
VVERLNPVGIPQPGVTGPARTGNAVPAAGARTGAAVQSFGDLLQEHLLRTTEGVKFSAHAQERLRSRAITLTPADMGKIDEAVRLASAKGARESLLLTDKAAFVVSVKNRTVITVVDSASMKENVFTNIDSAVIL